MESVIKIYCDRCGGKLEVNGMNKLHYKDRDVTLCNYCMQGLEDYLGVDSLNKLGDADHMDEEVEI